MLGGLHGGIPTGLAIPSSQPENPEIIDFRGNAGGNKPPFDALRRGTGLVFPTKFVPPSGFTDPSGLFKGRMRHMNVIRYTLPRDSRTVLIRTDGACLNNGQPNPQAGWAFWHGYTALDDKELTVSNRLEKKGPFGDDGPQTSNRAELRAVIAALRFRFWPGEGFRTFVVAADSEYVVEGATTWARNWLRNGWRTSKGEEPVKNRDLWEALLGEAERYERDGMRIEFWRIPRALNERADAAANKAAGETNVPVEWADVMGINV